MKTNLAVETVAKDEKTCSQNRKNTVFEVSSVVSDRLMGFQTAKRGVKTFPNAVQDVEKVL
jgi:hypothetical protein